MPALGVSTFGTIFISNGSKISSGLTLRTFRTLGGGSSGPSFGPTLGGGGSSASMLIPQASGSVPGRLIPQKGGRITKGEYGEDILLLPFKVMRGPGWMNLIPKKGSGLSDIPNMYLWDPQRDVATGEVMADVGLIYKGVFNDSLPDPIANDDTTIQTLTISNDVGETADFAFRAPRSIYRYIEREDPLGKPKFTTVRNSASRQLKILRYFIHGNDNSSLPSGEEEQKAFREFLAPLIREENVSTTSEQCGAYYLCQDICVKTFQDPFSV